MQEELRLGENEQIIERISPVGGFKRYLELRMFIALLICGLAAALACIYVFGLNLLESVIAISAIALAALLSSIFLSSLRYRNRYYWLTDRRLVMRCGLLRSRMVYVPYETITDVTLTHSLLERHFLSLGLRIASTRRNFTMGGVPAPEGIHMELTRLVKDMRREHGLVF